MTAPVTKGAVTGLEERIEALFRPAVTAAVTDPRQNHPPRFETEALTVAAATARRKREFFAGRAAVHQAMRRMGVRPVAVPTDASRAPVWPGALTGSISHSGQLCAAVLAESGAAPALGIDIEESTPLEDEIIPDICTLPERAWLSTQPPEQRGRLAKLIFSAKECAYKCQFMLSRTLIEFADLEVTLDLESGQFEATFTRDVPGFSRNIRLCGRYMVEAGHIITAIAAERHYAAPAMERRVSFW